MKKISVMSVMFALIAFAASAQCDTKTKWTASSTEFIRSSGEVQTKPGTVTVTVALVHRSDLYAGL